MAAKPPVSGTLAANGTVTLTCAGQDAASLHCVTIQGSGVVTISLKHLGQSTFTTYDTGVTADTNTYVMRGCNGVKIQETGTSNPVTYSYIAHD